MILKSCCDRISKTLLVTGATCTALLAYTPLPADAATFITERSALGGNDQVDWASLGKVFNPFAPDPTAFLPNSFAATSEGGLGINVDIPQPSAASITPPFVFVTNPIPVGIPTNFAAGDFILFTGFDPSPVFPAIGNPGPLTILFDTPVFGAGTQLAVDDAFTFTGFVEAFDPLGNLIASFEAPGTSSLDLDNSAAFFGVRSDQADIAKLVLYSSVPQAALGINRLSIVTEDVPEPATMIGLIAVGAMGWSLKRKMAA